MSNGTREHDMTTQYTITVQSNVPNVSTKRCKINVPNVAQNYLHYKNPTFSKNS